MKEHSLSVNNFNEPKIFDGNDAIATLLIRLFLLEPGTIKSHPKMGLGLVSRYRYSDTSKIDDLKSDISNQVSKYLPLLGLTDVEVKTELNNLLISISIDNKTYVFETTDQNSVTLKDILNS